ncbi:hypothetical protein V1503_19250 [Bacillus sp. SCS-151]|uniref:hypothetical protein n=1 Tax=Nanhaiella sioensis TaxID=3115293 RepID=UPI003979849B
MTISDYVLDQPLDNFIKLRQLDKYMFDHKGYIAGGIFKNIFNSEKFKDVDIFFENEKDYLEAEENFKGREDYKFRYRNDKVTAYLNTKTGVTVELIKHKYKSPLDMTKEFDFTITKFVYYKEKDPEEETRWKVAYHNKFFEHLHMKRLVIDEDASKIILPVNTFNRMFRYARFGYFPCKETKGKIIQSLRELPRFSDELLGIELYNGLD